MSVTVRLETVTTSKEAGCTTYAPRGSSFNKDRLFFRHALLPFDWNRSFLLRALTLSTSIALFRLPRR